MTAYKDAIRRVNAARGNKQLWEDHLRECYRYSMPERNTIDKYSPGQEKREYVYDSTAIDGLEDYANRMESQVVPPSVNWMKLEAGSDITEEEGEKVSEFLDETTKIVFNHIRSSNFSSQIHESFLDLGISTGAIIVEAGDGIQSSLNFRSVSLSELILERSQKGIADTVWRDITVQAGDIPHVWPKAKLTDSLARIVKEKPEEDVSLIEGVVLTSTGKYEDILIYEEESTYLYQFEVESSPWVVFRETTIPGEVYGRGRVMRVLPDIKSVNIMMEDYLKGLNIQANPIFMATDDGVINPFTASLTPGSVTPVGSNDSRNPSLAQLTVTGNLQLLEFAIRGLQDVIRRALMSKPFGNIEETPVRTATEMSIRNADNAQTQVGASGRIQSELLERLVARCVYILTQAGKVAPIRVDGKEVKIKYTSPIAKQQDELQLATLFRYAESMQMFPPEQVMAKIKIEDFPQEIAKIMGVPTNLLRSELEQEEQQQDMQAQQMAVQEAEIAQGGGNVQG